MSYLQLNNAYSNRIFPQNSIDSYGNSYSSGASGCTTLETKGCPQTSGAPVNKQTSNVCSRHSNGVWYCPDENPLSKCVCNGLGVCGDQSTCQCNTGYAGQRCGRCASGYININTNKDTLPICRPTKHYCSNRGTWNGTKCVCEIGFVGENCELAASAPQSLANRARLNNGWIGHRGKQPVGDACQYTAVCSWGEGTKLGTPSCLHGRLVNTTNECQLYEQIGLEKIDCDIPVTSKTGNETINFVQNYCSGTFGGSSITATGNTKTAPGDNNNFLPSHDLSGGVSVGPKQ
jgi:hypothetical protein